MNKTFKLYGLMIILLLGMISCVKSRSPFTIRMSDGLEVKMITMVDGKDAETILKNFPGNNLQIPKEDEFLLIKLSLKNTSTNVVTIPYLYFLQVDTKSSPPKTVQIYFKEEFEMPGEGLWKKLDRLKMIPSGETREGTICFVVPRNIVYKRFYVYQTYLTFPEGFQPTDIK